MYSVPLGQVSRFTEDWKGVECCGKRGGHVLNNRHVERRERDDRLAEQQYPRPGKRNLELLAHRLLRLSGVELGHVLLAGDLGQLLRASAEEDRRVRLGNEERDGYPDEACEGGRKTLELRNK